MVKWPKIFDLAFLSGVLLLTGPAPNLKAATSATLNIISNDAAEPPAGAVELGSLKPIPAPSRARIEALPSGNPLWAVPLSGLTAARERPIFSPSRRPPPAAVAAALQQASAPPPPHAVEPERPPLALIGAVVGESDAIAVFLDRTDQSVVRLRQGESHAGWLLSSVLPREARLQKADRIEVLVLQRQDGPASAAGTPARPGGRVLPTAAVTGTSYAPFVPHSTPKNGESDGL